MGWSMMEPEKAHQNIKKITCEVRGTKNLKIGSLVLVQIKESRYHTENPKEWVYARIAKKPEGSMILLYLTPDESQLSTFELERVLPIQDNIIKSSFSHVDLLKVKSVKKIRYKHKFLRIFF